MTIKFSKLTTLNREAAALPASKLRGWSSDAGAITTLMPVHKSEWHFKNLVEHSSTAITCYLAVVAPPRPRAGLRWKGSQDSKRAVGAAKCSDASVYASLMPSV